MTDLPPLEVDDRLCGPPWPLLVGATTFVIVGIVALFANPSTPWSAVGYFGCTLGAVGAVAIYRYVDARQRMRPGYRLLTYLAHMPTFFLIAAWAVAAADAWRLATELSR